MEDTKVCFLYFVVSTPEGFTQILLFFCCFEMDRLKQLFNTVFVSFFLIPFFPVTPSSLLKYADKRDNINANVSNDSLGRGSQTVH